VSVPVGSVSVPEPATSGAVTEIKPLVSPENPMLAILFSLRKLSFYSLYLSFPSIQTTVKDGV
jgi:hypothetical protein